LHDYKDFRIGQNTQPDAVTIVVNRVFLQFLGEIAQIPGSEVPWPEISALSHFFLEIQ
jgi:hypothetical protein